MRSRPELLAVLALAGLSACQEPPSFRLRWAIEGREMLDATACSESGLFQVRLRAYSTPDQVADERTYSCFSKALAAAEGNVDGSPLPPGRYALELRGIDRTGDTWDVEVVSLEPGAPEHEGCSPESDVIECRPGELVCDCQHLVVVPEGGSADEADATVVEERSATELPEFVLVPPPQCIDGIDNDVDGLVDVSDPSCNVDFGDGSEGVPVGVTELRVNLTLLDDNPVLTCAVTPLRRLQLAYGVGDAAEVVLEDFCHLDRPYFVSLRLPAGPTTFSAVGLDSGGTPVTIVKTFEAEISPVGGTVERNLDFRPDDFLEPVVGRIYVSPGYVGELGADALLRYTCEPPEIVNPLYDPTDPASPPRVLPRGNLVIDRLRVQLLNGHGGPLAVPATLEDGSVLDGSTAIDCTKDLVTTQLEWGSYTMALEALSAEGEVCFSNVDAPQLLGPGDPGAVLFAPRVYGSDGKVPASCHDCEVDADCNLADTLYCVDNVCQGRCTSDDDCVSDELGDLGFACIEGVCRRAG